MSEMTANGYARRDVLKAGGLLAAASGLWPLAVLRKIAGGGERETPGSAAPIGRREIVKGLDGMSRVADDGNDPFRDGHAAAAVISSAFLCRENDLEAGTQDAILSLLGARLLPRAIFAPRPEEAADLERVDGLVRDLDAGIDSLRGSGHNIIFAVVSLKALRDVPEAATPPRIEGLRAMVRSFGTDRAGGARQADKASSLDLGDEKGFVRFVFEEYLAALELYLGGRGHHGFAGHVLTIGHALIELRRMGHPETAQRGLAAYGEFLRRARAGADLGGRRVKDPPPGFRRPLDRDYWVEQLARTPDVFVASHLVKYPWSFYALSRDLDDDELKRRTLEKLPHLTAVS